MQTRHSTVLPYARQMSGPAPELLLGRSAAGLLDAALLVLSVLALLLMLLTLTACAGGLCRSSSSRSSSQTPAGWRLALSDGAALLLSQVGPVTLTEL